MNVLVSAIVLLLGFYTFFASQERKLQILLFSTLCLNFASFSFVSFGTTSKIICIFFFLSELRNFQAFIGTLKSTPFIKAIVIMIIVTVIQIMHSPHMNNLITIIGYLVNELIAKYFVIAYLFVSYQKNDDLSSFMHVSYISLLIITVIGIFSLATHSDPIKVFTMSEIGDQFVNHISRQRIVSLFIYPFDYGYAALMLLLFMIYGKVNNYISNREFYISVGCSIFGIFFCGCRTVLVTGLLSIGCFLFLYYSLIRFGWYIFLGILVCVGAYTYSPKFQNTVESTLSAFDPEAKMEKGGSSTLKDRALQYFTTYEYARKDIWLGRGYRFFENDLGYNKHGDGLYSLKGKARNLLGLEGVMMRLLLEQGLIGVLAYIIFYIILIRYAFKLKKYSPTDGAMAIATLAAFICFGNMTGELGGAIITFLFYGVYVKSAYQRKEEVDLQNENESSDEEELSLLNFPPQQSLAK